MPRESAGQPRRRDRISKHDVEFAKVQRSLELGRIVAKGIVWVLCTVALAVPILALQNVIEPLAGRTTIVEANIVISVAITVSCVLHGFQYLKYRSQRTELQRQRAIITELEQKLL